MPYLLNLNNRIAGSAAGANVCVPGRVVSDSQGHRITAAYRLFSLSLLVTIASGLVVNTALPTKAAGIVCMLAFVLLPVFGFSVASSGGRDNWFTWRFFSLCVIEGCFLGPVLRFAERAAPGLSELVGITSLAVVVLFIAYGYLIRLNYSRWLGFILCSSIVILVASITGEVLGATAVEISCEAGTLVLMCAAVIYDSSKLFEADRTQTPVEDAADLHLDVLCFFVTLLNLTSRLATKS